ncbi:Proclotting enzyme [Frankliniella fusca]|uniref:Proclotting enzyme n=1 Tax=Frankliniella fusca TaxID=407009 RepID=A0AAE1GU86_9NEOP|nr:Proclotting enzyme [Frankliniella fusca]
MAPRTFSIPIVLAVFLVTTHRGIDVTEASDSDADVESGRRASSRAERAILRSDSTHPHPTLITGDDDEEDLPFQSCITPNKEPGHCRHLRFCVLNEFKDNFDRFKDYACVIEGKFIGVCCPDDKDLYDSSRDYFGPLANRTGQQGQQQVGGNRSSRTRGSRRRGGARGRGDSRPSRRRKPRPVDARETDSDTCGVTQVMKRVENAKVEGGQDAEPGQFPWMAALLRFGEQQFCGAVLLDSTHVLTAAHCVYNLQADDLTVSLGEYDLSQPDPNRVQTFGVLDILVNERFNSDAYTDDIAILYLDGQAEFTDWVWPVCLPPPDMDYTGQLATVIGWGTVYYGGPPSNVLMEVTLPIWSQEDCQRQFDQPILETEICAGTEAGGRDSDGRWTNIGIVSFGVRCGEPGKPGVYTNVAFRTNDWAPPDRMTGQWEVEARQDDRGGEKQKEKFLRKIGSFATRVRNDEKVD